ncbi:WD-repeat protein [Reticulomyxa filosa]|uniref:WD-repeat protein n=1 Tax=Reticulomyxa filosa TaxID=46433 RepID=X6PAX9_RETFI|nr:WD-repeat protein [Reticulomyxa filosa]|eukprot:ETO35283.1 WD-repeat protein [Reticulomyxa filosa]
MGWIRGFDKIIINYVAIVLMLDTFCSNSKLIKTFTGYPNRVYSIDYYKYDNSQFLYFGTIDKIVHVWDVESNTQIKSFNGHSSSIYCVKFSPYHCYNNNLIRFWDIKDNRQLQNLMDIQKVFLELNFHHLMVNIYISPLQSNNNNNNIGIIGSYDEIIQIFNGHTRPVKVVEYSSFITNNNSNVICSGSMDNTIRFWDIRLNKNELNLIKGFDMENCGIFCLTFFSSEEKNNGCDINLCYCSYGCPIRIWG